MFDAISDASWNGVQRESLTCKVQHVQNSGDREEAGVVSRDMLNLRNGRQSNGVVRTQQRI